jgi:fructose-1-phosphate kinase PfkB-like protein
MSSTDLLIKALRAKNIPVQKVKVKNSTRLEWEICQSLNKNQLLNMTLK